MAQTLESKQKNLSVSTANDFETAIEIVKNDLEISIVVLALNINGRNGLGLISQLRKIVPNIKIIIFSMFTDPLHIEQSLQFDIDGYIFKTSTIDEILKTINSVANGNTCYNREVRSVMHTLFNHSSNIRWGGIQELFSEYEKLTHKEQEIFSLLAQEKNILEIANLLGRAEKTIQNQKSIIYQKMNVHDRLELIKAAKKLGVIF